jgi:hypothetical protein
MFGAFWKAYMINENLGMTGTTREGYIAGENPAEKTTFSIGIGKAAHAKLQLKVNDVISGECLTVPDPDMEPVDYYKVSKLKKLQEGEPGSPSTPWEITPPELEVYRERGRRRLAARTYDTKCLSCVWGARRFFRDGYKLFTFFRANAK